MTPHLAKLLSAGLLLAAAPHVSLGPESRVALVWGPSVVAAQDAPRPPTARGAPALLADATFTPGTFEPIRIFLARGIVYRAEFSEPGIQVEMRSYEGKSLPFVLSVNYGADVSGRTIVELRPQVDGEIEFRPVFVASGRAVRFQLWNVLDDHTRDLADEPGEHTPWEFGLMAEFGSHGRYVNRLVTYGHSGSTSAACVAIRRGPGILRRAWGCVLGVESDDGGLDGRIAYLYVEPRVRVIGGRRPGRPTIDAGVLLRFAGRITEQTGTVVEDPSGPTTYGVGLYAGAQYWESGGGGWTIAGSVHLQQITSRAEGSSGAGTTVAQLTVGRFF
jgi:hypothetical protein